MSGIDPSDVGEGAQESAEEHVGLDSAAPDDDSVDSHAQASQVEATLSAPDTTDPSLTATTPSAISMSAGADPWAEPSAYAPHISEMRKPERDNPWATNSPAPDSVDDSTATGDAARGSVLDATSKSSLHEESGSNAKADTDHTSSSLSDQTAFGTESVQQTQQAGTHKLVEDDWQGEYDLPKLGKSTLRHWAFKSGLVNLNNGSYGACPRPVMEAHKALEDQQEEAPDLFRHETATKLLAEQREKVAQILSCDAQELSFITNSTTGTNAVLRDLVFTSGDAVICLTTTYGAVINNLDYLIENERQRGIDVSVIQVPLTFPKMKKQDILRAFEAAIDQAQQRDKKRIRLGIVDTIISRPGIRLPWEDLVQVLRSKGIPSMVDGAHGIGHIPINLSQAQPDYFVSNCHKWLYAHRGNAVLYVPKRNQHLQRSSLPTSWFYTKNATSDKHSWLQQWEMPGTDDLAARLSVTAALAFRQSLGGEARIMNYNHDLAVRGGRAAARILGTEVMDDADNTMTASMVNVRLPILLSNITSARVTASAGTGDGDGGSKDLTQALTQWSYKAMDWFFDRMYGEFKVFAPVYVHDNKVWVRFSAQVWLEVDDFEYAARALLDLCKRINSGQVPELQD